MTDKLCYIIAEGLDSMRKYSKELYSKDVLMKAAYAFTDDVYVHLDCDNENYMVSVTSKLDESEENLFNKFENELIAQETRKIIAGQTKNIREMIVARALSSTMVHLNEENVKDEESFDAKEISKSWFDKNE